VERRFRRVEDWSGRPDVVPGGRKRHRRREGSSRYQASTDRQWAKTDSGASARRPTRIEGRRRHRPSEPAARQRSRQLETRRTRIPQGGNERTDNPTAKIKATEPSVQGARKPARKQKRQFGLDKSGFIEGRTLYRCIFSIFVTAQPRFCRGKIGVWRTSRLGHAGRTLFEILEQTPAPAGRAYATLNLGHVPFVA